MSIVEEINAGRRLSIHLQPDHGVIPTDIPEYNETLALPFACTQGSYFTGSTRPAHFHRDGDSGPEMLGFAYTNALPAYSIVNPARITSNGAGTSQIAVKLMSCRQYRVLDFVTRPAGRHILTIDHGGVTRHEDLRESLRLGGQHYAVVKIDEIHTWSHPIDIVYDFFPDERLEFVTEAYYTSQHCQFPESFRQETITANPDIAAALDNPLFNAQVTMPLTTTYLRITEEGLFQDRVPGVTATPYLKVDIYEYP